MISLGKTPQRKVETLKRLKRLNNPNNWTPKIRVEISD